MMEKGKKYLLIIGFVWPEPESSAAGSRMMQLISLFQSAEWDITFASAAQKSSHSADLEAMNVKTVSVPLNSSLFDRFVRQLRPGAVLFDRFMTEEQFGWRVAGECPDALRILDTEDLHCLRKTREKIWKTGKEFQLNDLNTQDITKREIAAILRSDLSLIISRAEMEILTDHFQISKSVLHYLPFFVDAPDASGEVIKSGFKARKHFVAIGNFLHEPNRNSVRYLREQVWPAIRNKLPGAELHIYGAYASQQDNQLHSPGEGFYMKGRAEDADEVVRRARVLLAPLQFGAGLKGKLLKAMQCGTPSVTTPVGAEGMAGSLAWSGAVTGDAEEFAESAMALYTQSDLWKAASEQGFKIIDARFRKDRFAGPLLNKINQLRFDLNQHRMQNFMGSMLMHHTLASTKYMGRWIEEKSAQKPAADSEIRK